MIQAWLYRQAYPAHCFSTTEIKAVMFYTVTWKTGARLTILNEKQDETLCIAQNNAKILPLPLQDFLSTGHVALLAQLTRCTVRKTVILCQWRDLCQGRPASVRSDLSYGVTRSQIRAGHTNLYHNYNKTLVELAVYSWVRSEYRYVCSGR